MTDFTVLSLTNDFRRLIVSSVSSGSSSIWDIISLNLSVISSSYIFSPNMFIDLFMISSSGISTSPFSFRDSSSFTSWVRFIFLFGSSTASKDSIISMTSLGAENTFPMFWKRKLLIKPLLTTSTDLIFRGMESTSLASSSFSSPFSSSPITGKKLRRFRIFCSLSSAVPPPVAVAGLRLLANCSNMVRVRAGSKSNT